MILWFLVHRPHHIYSWILLLRMRTMVHVAHNIVYNYCVNDIHCTE